MTPIELMAMFARQAELSVPVRERQHKITHMGPFAGSKPEGFQRMAIHPDVTLYRDPKIGTARKKLIVAFCGARNRLDMPMPAVLQSLPAREVDIVVLRDRTRQHYLNGIGGYAPDFQELAAAIARDVRPQKYSDVYAYGTSMGGFAAIRFGLLSPVRRAVAMGGSFPGYVRRLIDRRPVPGFDLLCDCMASRAKFEIVAVYGEGSEADRRNSEWLARICPARPVAVPEVSIHNVAHSLALSGRLPAFFATTFDLEGADPARFGLSHPPARPIVSAA